MSLPINAPVSAAIENLHACFPSSEIVIEPDGNGGARVAVETVELSDAYVQNTTWLAGHLVSQLPYADIYPIFVRGDLARRDGRPLGTGLSPGHMFLNRSAVQASRRSNRRDPALELAGHKFLKVIEWLRTHSGA
ncbi:MAG: hypothetical protein WBO04_04330 [Steroidobacteraceae bacterium]